MKYSMIGYLLGEGFRNVGHNKKSAGASLAIMCATMLIFGLFFIVIENINYLVKTIETEQGMQVFIDKDTTDTQIEEIGNSLKAIDGVNKVTYVSKEDALNQMKEKLKNKQSLLAGWDEDNPFRASYYVTLTDLTKNDEVQTEIKKIDKIAEISSKNDTINGLISVAIIIIVISATILTMLVVISIFIISNTIKLAVHARRKEISIMKYVGATDGFIRWPFIVEGVIIGVLAAMLSLVIIGIVYYAGGNAITGSVILQKVGYTLLSFSDMVSLLVTVYLVLGIGIGTLGSVISMRKYLKV